jgi:hypothetical protein
MAAILLKTFGVCADPETPEPPVPALLLEFIPFPLSSDRERYLGDVDFFSSKQKGIRKWIHHFSQ